MEIEKLEHGELQNWQPDEVHAAQKDGSIVLIDVRTPQEFAFERIHGALLSPVQEFDPEQLPGQEAKRIVFHCGSGVRSKKMAEVYLKRFGGSIAHMAGGFGAWKKAELPYVGTDMGTGAPKTINEA